MRVQAKQCGSRVMAKVAGGTQSMRHQCGAVLDELDGMPSVAQAFRAEMSSWRRARVVTTAHNCDMMSRHNTGRKDHQECEEWRHENQGREDCQTPWT